MSSPAQCPICDGKGEVHTFNYVEFAWTPRVCPNCKGKPWPPKKNPTAKRNPTYEMALAAITFQGYILACRRRELVPISRNTYDTWRRRARQAAAGQRLT